MSSGVSRTRSGSFGGTGADKQVRTVGFRPKWVKVINEDGLCQAEWFESMADDSALKTVTAGTLSFITSNGITPLSDGFALGADGDLNVADEKVHWFVSQ